MVPTMVLMTELNITTDRGPPGTPLGWSRKLQPFFKKWWWCIIPELEIVNKYFTDRISEQTKFCSPISCYCADVYTQ